jgi:hypothetical protein
MAAETGKIDESQRAIALTWAMLNMPPIAGVSSVQLSTYFALGEAAAILGDRVTARLVLEYLEPFAELPITGSLAVSCFGSTWRSIALAHRTLGNVDSAINGWRLAIDNNIRIGHLPMVAICRAELAQILVDEVCDDDGEAVKQLSEAIRIGTVCGLSLRVEGWQNSINTTIGLRPPLGPLSITDRSGSLQRTSEGWTIVCVLGSAVVSLRKGMEHLAVLLQSPGTSISIAELVGATAAPRQLVLDAQAQSNLRIRVRDLQSELDEALVLSDPTTSAAVRSELDCIADEVERSTGLFGRSRAFVDDSERARTAVQKSIKRVLDEIEAQAPVLGGELRKAIRTGSRCTFVPSETLPARWVLHRADPQEK